MSIPPSFQATPATSSHLTKVILDKQVVLDFTAGWGISCNMVPPSLLLAPGSPHRWDRAVGETLWAGKEPGKSRHSQELLPAGAVPRLGTAGSLKDTTCAERLS